MLTAAALLVRQGGEHRPDGHQHHLLLLCRGLGFVFRRFLRCRGRDVGAARQPERGGRVLAGEPQPVWGGLRES